MVMMRSPVIVHLFPSALVRLEGPREPVREPLLPKLKNFSRHLAWVDVSAADVGVAKFSDSDGELCVLWSSRD